jgi:hypothetical protein
VRWAVIAAGAAYVASWFLPVVHVPPGGIYDDVDAGWKAFALTVLGVFSPNKLGWISLFFLASVLTNLPVLMAPWMLRRTPVPLWFVIALLVSFLLNLAWIPLLERVTPLAGYWLWIGSMSLLAAVAIYRRAAQGQPPPAAVERHP